jgi:hypothetical protein
VRANALETRRVRGLLELNVVAVAVHNGGCVAHGMMDDG